MFISILGRQPAISMAELERTFNDVRWLSNNTALFESPTLPDVERLGGSQKVGQIISQFDNSSWDSLSTKIAQRYIKAWSKHEGKITLGISAYGFDVAPREVQKLGITLKSRLKELGVSVRLVPNAEAALSTATSHHNKLGLSSNKVELLIARGDRHSVLAESLGAQNITALARRDQNRPKRDAYIGMLPPKLAQIMVNLAAGQTVQIPDTPKTILDPFCGTGVILQEAYLFGYRVFGSDINPKMIDYTAENLSWLQQQFGQKGSVLTIREADATDYTWPEAADLDAVVSEVYLGQPFSAPPSPKKLTEVIGNCNAITTKFLRNLSKQIKPGTQLCIAVPAWNDGNGKFTHLPLIRDLSSLGYSQIQFKNVAPKDLLYHRPGQIVAREILVLAKN